MQSVIRSSEQRVDNQRKQSEAARARACRNNLSLMIFGTLLLATFVVTNIVLLRDFLQQPFAAGDPESQRFIGPLLRDRLRRARESARGGQANRTRFDGVASWMKGKRRYAEAVMKKVQEMKASSMNATAQGTAPGPAAPLASATGTPLPAAAAPPATAPAAAADERRPNVTGS